MNFINAKRRNLLQQATLEKCRVSLVSVGSLLKKPNKSCYLKVLSFSCCNNDLWYVSYSAG